MILFPFLAWLAIATSAILIVALWYAGELGPVSVVVSIAWFVLAAYCQFFGASAIVGVVGLSLQTILAIYLIVRWRWIS